MFERQDRTAQGWCGKTVTGTPAWTTAKTVTMILAILFAGNLFFTQVLTVRAGSLDGEMYVNPDSGYKVVVEDDADLLTDEEEKQLAKEMRSVTEYGNAAFKTIDRNSSSASGYAKSYYKEKFGQKSGMVFLIDMDNREIYIFCDGAIYHTITKKYAYTITDNVYTYASKEDYYKCGSKAFEQATALLRGQRIAQPMKYICNALLALIGALLLNFGIVNLFSKAARTEDKELLAHAVNNFSMTQPVATFLNQSKRYNPVSSGSSSGGGHSGGGGGHHSSGGGGGHKF